VVVPARRRVSLGRDIGDKPPELAIVDWGMPIVDASNLCRRVREASLPMPVYVILLTSRNSRQDLVGRPRKRGRRYLTKPVRSRRAAGADSRRPADARADREHQAAQRSAAHLQLCKRIRSDEN